MEGRAIPGGYKVKDANGQALAYVYGRETRADADIAHVLTMDEARRIASNIVKLPGTVIGKSKNLTEQHHFHSDGKRPKARTTP